MLFMNTVSFGIETILRPRRRPAKTATNAKSSREVFGNEPIKELLIPRFIDNYNYYMGGVDQADQLRSLLQYSEDPFEELEASMAFPTRYDDHQLL